MSAVTTLSRRTLLASAALLIVGIAAFVAWSWHSPAPGEASASSRTSAVSASIPSPSAATTPGVNVPSSSEPSAVPSATLAPEETRTAPAPAPAPVPSPAGGPRRVGVVTTFSGWNATSGAVEVGGYAAVVEPPGTCTLRLSHGDRTVTHKQIASADATTVACGGFSVPRSELSAGVWKAVLGYTSSTSAGEAAPVTVEVP